MSLPNAHPDMLVFIYQGRRVAVLRPETYEDAVNVAQREMGLTAMPKRRIGLKVSVPAVSERAFEVTSNGVWQKLKNEVKVCEICLLLDMEMHVSKMLEEEDLFLDTW